MSSKKRESWGPSRSREAATPRIWRAGVGCRSSGRGERRVAALLLGLSLGATALASAESHPYRTDPAHLTMAFLVEHIGYAKVLGRFREAEATFVFDESSRRISEVEVVVQTESVFSNSAERDRHLRSPDFLNVKQFPRMIFRSSGTTLDADGNGRLAGELELLGRTLPLVLDVTWNRSARSPLPGPDGSPPYVLGASARGSFERSRFGMTYGVDNGLVGDVVELLIELEAWRE